MAQPDFTSFPVLMEQVAQLCAQRQTGTVMLVSDDNRMAQVHLRNGEIVFVMCRGRRGRDALGIMRTMAAARLTFVAGVVDSNEAIDWPTKVVLDYLSGQSEDLPGGDGVSTPASRPSVAALAAAAPRPAPAAGAASAPAVARPSAGAGVNAATKALLEKVMLTYIGPMAQIVCGDHFANATDARALTLALATEIPGKPQQAKFKAEIAKLLDLAPFD